MANTHLQYDRRTINLVFELKRSLPLDKQADFKLSNPDLVPKVKEIYLSASSRKSKALAKRVLEKAGVPIRRANKSLLDVFKVGEKTTADTDHVSSPIEPVKAQAKSVKMYRGQVVD